MDSLEIAYNLALDNLRSLYGKEGIFAGARHFKDYWSWDSYYASFGCLAAGDHDIVKSNLSLHMSHMNKHGQLPLRIGATTNGIVLAYFGITPKKRVPIYTIDKSKFPPVTQNSLFIVAFLEYIMKTNDLEYLKNNIQKVEKILLWNFINDKDNDLLVEENEYCNWADSIKKKGKVLYTNVCHCHALNCMSDLFKIAGDKKKQAYYLEKHNEVKGKINELFWSGEHYIDWIDEGRHYNYFSTDGNILAILWDVADKEKAIRIEEASHIFDINDVPSACVHPFYPMKLVSPELRLIGLGDYHNGVSWLWLGCINALAKDKIGMKKEAVEILNKMSDIIIKENGVYEIYENNRSPVNRLIYKAEYPFAWSSGLFVYAIKKIKSQENLKTVPKKKSPG